MDVFAEVCNQLFYSNRVSNLIGKGVDGEVFQSLDNPNEVIKFGVVFHAQPVNIERNINYIMEHNPCTYVHVHDFSIKPSKHELLSHVYVCFMEKLSSLSNDEIKLFHTLVSHEDSNKKKDITDANVVKITEDLSFFLDFDKKKVRSFCSNYLNSNIIHHDLHPRNIMKDKNNNFKLIDLDRISIKGD